MTNSPIPADVLARSAIRTNARRWGRNPYAQAAILCARRWTFRLVGLWLLACVALMSWGLYKMSDHGAPDRAQQRDALQQTIIPPNDGFGQGMILTMMIALIVVPAFLTVFGHAREQVTDWRGTVAPNYRKPHLLTAAVGVATTTLIVGGLIYALVPFSEIGLMAVLLGMAAISGWSATLPQKGAAGVSIGAVVFLAFGGVRAEIQSILYRQDPASAVVALLIAVVALAGVWLRLARVGESSAAKRADDELRLGMSLPALRRGGAMSLWRRVALWRVPSSSGWLPAACGAGLFVLDVVLCLTPADGRQGDYGQVSFPLAYLSVIVPAMAVGSQWARRLPGIGYEMTRPFTRRAFVREVGLALAIDWAAWWVWLTAGALAGVALALSRLSGSKGAPPVELLSAITYVTVMSLVLSAAIQVLLCSILAWAMSFQAKWGVYAATTAGVILGVVGTMYAVTHASHWGAWRTAGFAGGVATLGLLVFLWAYRRWLNADVVE